MSLESSKGIYELVRHFIERILTLLDRTFNKIFSSEFNPLYRSGTIAVALLSFVTVTGLILVFFYRLQEPYESVKEIQSAEWLRWLRSYHRYASDAAVVAVVVHIFRMFAQKKSWGPRILAWCSGVALLALLMVSGWTGFVMVWDAQAQKLAISGSSIFDSLGIFVDPISRSFDGSVKQPPPSFFFLNLFLHIAIPLSMIFGIWIHTAKMARATWFPNRNLLYSLGVLFLIISFAWSATLDDKADLLLSPSLFSKDIFFNFWLTWGNHSPRNVSIFWSSIILGLLVLPFVLKPQAVARPQPSDLDEKKCHGCTQCVTDCPYEAIQMIRRKSEPFISDTVAIVNPLKCVSCGLCAASCGPMTIGPPERKGTDQYQAAKSFTRSLLNSGTSIENHSVVVGCSNQSFTLHQLRTYIGKSSNLHLYPVACMGSLHMATIGYLAQHFKSILLAACPERNCTNKDAYLLLRDRLAGVREPGLPSRVDSSRVTLLSVGEGEESKAFEVLERSSKVKERFPSKVYRLSKAFFGGLILLTGISYLSNFSPTQHSSTPNRGNVRLSWRLAGQSVKKCTKRTKEELTALPAHMRTAETCTEEKLAYQLKISIDGKVFKETTIQPGGFRSDRPLYVAENVELSEGTHRIVIHFEPEETEASANALRLNFDEIILVRRNEISLIHLSADQKNLRLKQREAL